MKVAKEAICGACEDLRVVHWPRVEAGTFFDWMKRHRAFAKSGGDALDPKAWEEEHAANPPATKKRKSKSKSKKKGEDGDEEDELAADEDAAEEDAEEEEEEKAGKKRKRASSPAPTKGKAKPKAAAAAKTKKGGKTKKSKAAIESEDDAGEDGEGDGEEGGEETEERASKKSKVAKEEDSNAKLESDPEALKVREWRHKLQKTFLSSNKAPPKEDEMPAVDTLFTTVEGYENMNIGYLTFSKIGKVMRHIHLLEASKVPRDDEFHFRDRAKALVDKWHGILNSNKPANGTADGEAGEAGSAGVTEGTARLDLNGTGEGEGDLTMMDTTMDEA
ncbi:PWWP domain-containing protein [Mycena venus]|uniref:PWWP domain-containing protein n=1 Tax=Mycena venus TaxID=2733690 RepID=A0A8H6XK60_9AGAR|nr:PWWP domain-containing protein [Mycena venus]